jgi:hypothetical protein
MVKCGRRPVTKISRYPNVRTNGIAPRHTIGIGFADWAAIEINSAETAAEITTGSTPPSTPRNFSLGFSLLLVSRSGRILTEIDRDRLAWEKHRQQDVGDTCCSEKAYALGERVLP